MIHFGRRELHSKLLLACLNVNRSMEKQLDEFQAKMFWALKALNMDESLALEHRLLQLNQLNEFQILAYGNAKIYNEKMKNGMTCI